MTLPYLYILIDIFFSYKFKHYTEIGLLSLMPEGQEIIGKGRGIPNNQLHVVLKNVLN